MKSFIYDSIKLMDSTLTVGSISGGSFSSGSNPTNKERLVDQSILNGISSFGSNTVKFVLSAGADPDIIAIYLSSANVGGTFDIDVYGATSDTVGSSKASISTEDSGWFTATITNTGNQTHWFVDSTNPATDNIFNECIIGKKLDFDVNPDLSMATSEQHGVTLNTSYGGVDFATKRHDSRSQWTLNFSNISSSFKTDLESMRDSLVGPFQPFLYYNDEGSGSYNWVRMTDDSLSFTEIAHQRYSTSISMIQQL